MLAKVSSTVQFLLIILYSRQTCGQCYNPVGCPPCMLMDGLWYIYCQHRSLTSVPLLQNMPVEISLFSLRDNEISLLPDNAFVPQNVRNVKVRRIDLTGNPISNISSAAFAGLDTNSLNELYIEVSKMRVFPVTALRSLVNLTVLNISGFILPTFPTASLQSLTALRVLNVQWCELTSLLPSDVEAQRTSLTSLILDFNFFQSVPTEALASLSVLRLFSMAHSSMTSLSGSSFTNVTSLLNLDLSFSRLNFISSDTFFSLSDSLEILTLISCQLSDSQLISLIPLKRLKYLDLSYNVIVSLPLNTFIYMRNLISLNLRSNKITAITGSSFNGLGGSLHELYCADNKIVSIDPKSFEQFSQLQVLDLSNQNLSSSLEKMIFIGLESSLLRLRLSKVNFRTAHFPSIANLRALINIDLSYNEIDSIAEKTFDYMILQFLDMQHNLLTSISQSQIYGLRNSLKMIYLDSNNISSISNCTFEGFTNLHTISLLKNPLYCDCRLIWLRQKLVADVELPFGYECSAPAHLAGIELQQLSDDNLTCNSALPLSKCYGFEEKNKTSENSCMIWLNAKLLLPNRILISWQVSTDSIVDLKLEYYLLTLLPTNYSILLHPTSGTNNYTIVGIQENTVYVFKILLTCNNTGFIETHSATANITTVEKDFTSIASVVIGCVIGGVIVLILIAITIVCLVVKRKRKDAPPLAMMPQAGSDTKRFSRPKSNELPTETVSPVTEHRDKNMRKQENFNKEHRYIYDPSPPNLETDLSSPIPLDYDTEKVDPDHYYEIADEHFGTKHKNIVGSGDLGKQPAFLVSPNSNANQLEETQFFADIQHKPLGFVNKGYAHPFNDDETFDKNRDTKDITNYTNSLSANGIDNTAYHEKQ